MLAVFLFMVFLATQVSWASAPQQRPEQSSFSVREINPFNYVCIPYKGPLSDREKVAGTLVSAMQGQNIFQIGTILGIYYNSAQTVQPEELVWEVGFPVASDAMPQEPLEKKEWNFTTVVIGLHVGPYTESGKTIHMMMEWMRANNYAVDGPILERYLDMDPSRLMPGGLRTEIWIPCRKSAGTVFLRVKAQLANVRSGPDPASNVLAQLVRGTVVESSGTTGGFYEISLKDQYGQAVQGFIDIKTVEIVSGEEVQEEVPEPVPQNKEEPQVEKKPKVEEKPKIQEKPKPAPAKKVATALKAVKKVSLELGFYYSLMNSYNRGLLDEWFIEVTADPTRLVDAGSPAFYNFSGVLFIDVSPNFALGFGTEVMVSAPRALWGTQIFWGGRQEIALNPFIVGFKVPLRLKIGGAGMMMSITASPMMLMGWVTGTYDNSATSTYWEFTPSSKTGFGVSGGIETFFGKSFGVGMNVGMRSLTVGLSFKDPGSSTGYSTPILSSGTPVTVDLGGTYVTTGLLIRF